MANPISRFMNGIMDNLAMRIASFIPSERKTKDTTRKDYYLGSQKKQLKLKSGQADDNLTTNFVGLGVDRSVSMLFGGGVDFVFPDAESPEAQYSDLVWRANKKEILLDRLGIDGEIYGTGYIKIKPDGYTTGDRTLPRLVVLDPSLMAINCNPMDLEVVEQYVFEVDTDDGAIREITRRTEEGETLNDENVTGGWVVETWKATKLGPYKLINAVPWNYDFPPIIHGQNLPSIHSVYGLSGVDGALEIQDKYNLVTSNVLKIIRYHAHPKTWGRGLSGNTEKVSWGADELIKIASENGMIANLEMQSDLTASRAIMQNLRQSIFDLQRVVDISSLADKAGQLTNFGLRVLYSDALSKNATKRLLYGEMLKELNRRLLVMGGFETVEPPEVKWGPDLPADETEDARLVLEDLAAGLVSKETAATQRGYTWEGDNGEQSKIRAEKGAGDNLLNASLANFFAGNNRNARQ